VDRGLDVAGDGDVDEEEAPAPTRLHGRADHVEGDDEGLGGGAGDDDVGFDEAGGEVGKRAWRAAHLLGQELRALEAAVDDDELGAEADEELGGSFGHLARAEEDDRAAYELAENLLGQVDGDARDRDLSLADGGLGAHALGDVEGPAQDALQEGAEGAGLLRELEGVLDLAENLRLADDQRIEGRRDAEE